MTAGSTPGAGAGATASAAADPTAGLPNGTKLAGWLLPASAVPKLKANPTLVNNSGDTFVEPSNASITKSKACDLLNGTNWMTAGGVGPAAFAGTDFNDSYGNEYYQELDAFENTRAAQEIAGLKKVFTECKSFPMTQGGTTYRMHLKVKELPGLGDEAVESLVTSPSLTGGQTMVVIRSGKLLIATSYNDQNGSGAEALTLARQLLKKLPAAAG
ncbi:hypothetical protein DN069_19015 [Streptacidiphilus pinicola]|uniref:Sensor domain-containing protein n=1 Tax=Streptacidiphilus pinicola TaxID=2219663 RepID=A0A2X0IKX4_9ACTN|nr:hypothetical protein DN069_19015 [Streptacidiphilus pinicola]